MTDQILENIHVIDELMPETGLTSVGIPYANDISFVVAMIFNALQAKFSKGSLKDITEEWNIKIAPAGWAFAIWGVIYTLLGGFVIFQSQSSIEVDTDVIYGQVGYMFSANMLANGLWLVLFG